MKNFIRRWKQPKQDTAERIRIGLETVALCQAGFYEKGTRRVPLSRDASREYEQTVAYSPEALAALEQSDAWQRRADAGAGRICVVQSDSFQAARRFENALVMNFANARQPGGNFFRGARGQEEALCRSSTLYSSLSSATAAQMYDFNKELDSPLDSDYMLLTPTVYVFRDLSGDFLDEPYRVSVITVPAPYKASGAITLSQAELDEVVKQRLRRMLTVAACRGYPSLILGAWGCGAFGHDPADMARCFYEVLVSENYAARFDHIVFAITNDTDKLRIFKKQFASSLHRRSRFEKKR